MPGWNDGKRGADSTFRLARLKDGFWILYHRLFIMCGVHRALFGLQRFVGPGLMQGTKHLISSVSAVSRNFPQQVDG